jgi:hypothetical protein
MANAWFCRSGLIAFFIHTAYLRPLPEPPWHFFNCTKISLQ